MSINWFENFGRTKTVFPKTNLNIKSVSISTLTKKSWPDFYTNLILLSLLYTCVNFGQFWEKQKHQNINGNLKLFIQLNSILALLFVVQRLQVFTQLFYGVGVVVVIYQKQTKDNINHLKRRKRELVHCCSSHHKKLSHLIIETQTYNGNHRALFCSNFLTN